MMKKMLSMMAVLAVIFGMEMFTGCKSNNSADLVVYGKIYTAEGNQIVEAFAVKDGKYVYVGDKAGAEAFVEEGKTEVVDYSGKGLVMPGCGNAHAHYSLGYAIQSVGTVMSRDTDVDKFIKEIVPAAVKKAKDNGANVIFGSGWEMMKFPKDLCYRKMLDEVCSDIPIYFADEEGHKGLANTILLKKAGLIKEDGTAGKTKVRGGEIVLDADGVPTGYVKEQAGTYVRSFLDNEYLFSVDVAKANMAGIQEQLLSEGYTMYQDGYSSYFFNDNFYKAAQQMDQAGDMHFVLGTAWELDSWMDVDKTLDKAAATKKYESAHIRTNWLKMFMDGTVESGTGFVDPLYPDNHQGIPNWSEEELTDITRKANERGITMHVHVMGNKGVERIVNAYVKAGKKELRNTLVHVYGVNEPDYQRMADNNIYVTSGMLWHHADSALQEELLRILPEGLKDKGYPMKSFFDYGINLSSHSDFPALCGAPDDPFGIMEIVVTGVYYPEQAKPWWTEECLSREQAITALTINVAKQMFLENERGSVKEGKYADFLLVDKDVLTCPVNEIHTAKPAATYFEGKKVFGELKD
ncbi:MAG: amidohydrolase family protein [Prevotella sp.]|nr:amidohydrolase family protein [Prevotella sp.]